MKPLSILLDARKLGDGGIGIYLENLIEGLLGEKERGFPLEVTAIVSPASEKILERFSGSLRVVEDSAKKYSLDEYLRLPKRLAAVFREHDIFHAPHYTLPRGISIPSVVTIHDTIHLMAPENLSQRLFAGFLMRSAMRRAGRLQSAE